MSENESKSEEHHEQAAPGAASGGNLPPRLSWAGLGVDVGAIFGSIMATFWEPKSQK